MVSEMYSDANMAIQARLVSAHEGECKRNKATMFNLLAYGEFTEVTAVVASKTSKGWLTSELLPPRKGPHSQCIRHEWQPLDCEWGKYIGA